MTDLASGLLLDTCAVIWLVEGKLSKAVWTEVFVAGVGAGIFVSPISAWEVGMLSKARGSRPAVKFLPDPTAWFANLMARNGIREASFTPAIAIAASSLPGIFHADPADRLLVATARQLGIPLVTGDAKIIEYAEQGFVDVIRC